jgi:hypothetical protein
MNPTRARNAMKRLLTLLLTCILLFSITAQGSAKKTRRPADGAPKSVHVKEYTKKNGKTVKSHERRAPKSS